MNLQGHQSGVGGGGIEGTRRSKILEGIDCADEAKERVVSVLSHLMSTIPSLRYRCSGDVGDDKVGEVYSYAYVKHSKNIISVLKANADLAIGEYNTNAKLSIYMGEATLAVSGTTQRITSQSHSSASTASSSTGTSTDKSTFKGAVH